MINPSDMEVEVDHSFFDSDCGSGSEPEEKKVEQVLKVEEESQAPSEGFPAKTPESRHGDRPLRTDETSDDMREVKSRTKSTRNRRHRVSSASRALSEIVQYSGSRSSSSDCDGDTNLNYERPKDVIQNLSTSSSKADADLESCSSQRSRLESPTLPKTSEASSYPDLNSTEEGCLGPERLQTASTEESDYTVTDVSPLSSPDSSRSLCLDHTTTDSVDHDEYQEESLPSSGLGNRRQDSDVDECSCLCLESEFQNKVVIHYPGKKSRQNYSFTDDEVRRIDQENHRLLLKLSRLSPGLRPESAPRRKTHVASASPLVHLSHSAMNRKREQQRIQRENLAFIKKLESAKPTPSLKRSQQLADYQRNVGSLGLPSYSINTSGVDTGPASRMKSTGSRSVSHSSHTLLPQTRKTRADWCS
ncbi:cilia- and flagella-associated protein 97 isoform X2 [Gouania willdenowi]|nr:cilia- and flagella-associated protein 97 isoform X2 [Gouania willdenowi]